MDGQRIVALRGSAAAFSEETSQGGNDFVWIPASGGAATVIMPSGGLQNAHFVKDKDRIYASGGRGLVSFRWDGTDIREHVRVSAGGAPGGGGGGGGAGASTIFMSPDGDQALALVGSDAWVVTVPLVGGTTPTVTVGDNPNFPARKLDEIGAQFPHWDWTGAQGALLDRQRARRSTISSGAHVRRLHPSGESRSRHRWSAADSAAGGGGGRGGRGGGRGARTCRSSSRANSACSSPRSATCRRATRCCAARA